MLRNLDGQQALALLTALALAAMWLGRFRRRRSGELAGAFARAKETKTEYGRFTDVAANEEAIRSLSSLAEYLKKPEKYARLGARMPRGVLLYGPPGTGKTMMARAMAAEAGAPFFALSGSDFVEMYAGVGASRVRSLFARARKAQRAVIFIDEIDALGKKRGGENSDERDQTLNALLSEMSAGGKRGETILVVAATNRAEALDPALTRPGRFDRKIEVGLPDREQRLSILRLHAKNKPMARDVDLEALAADTVRFSGAALECLLNEAAIRAAEAGKKQIGWQEVSLAYREAVAGADRGSARPGREDLAHVAAHEAGHALISRLRAPDKRILRVSILPTTRGAGGYSLAVGEETRLWTRGKFLSEIDVLLAGRAAEEVLLGKDEITSGATDDMARAAELAAAMAGEMGLCGDRAVHRKALSRALGCGAEGAYEESRALLEERYGLVVRLLSAQKERLDRLGKRLLSREALTGKEVDDCIFGGKVEKEP